MNFNMNITKQQLITASQLGAMQFLNWGISTISWRSVAQANYVASVITDTSLATLTFFVLRKMIKEKDDNSFILWFGYTVGGVLGTLSGIYLSIQWLGK